MSETSQGFTYPTATAHTRTWEHWQALAESIDAEIVQAVPRTYAVEVTTDANGVANVLYPPGHFASRPVVSVTPRSGVSANAARMAWIQPGDNANGCIVIASDGTSGVAITVHVVATLMRPGSPAGGTDPVGPDSP